ncbi:hypothetical protein ABZZ17_34750 [Streptomyces sp. NPDC006512]
MSDQPRTARADRSRLLAAGAAPAVFPLVRLSLVRVGPGRRR